MVLWKSENNPLISASWSMFVAIGDNLDLNLSVSPSNDNAKGKDNVQTVDMCFRTCESPSDKRLEACFVMKYHFT